MPGFNQKGVAHILLLIAALGILSFIAISSSASFKDKLFATLFPKPKSHASEAPIFQALTITDPAVTSGDNTVSCQAGTDEDSFNCEVSSTSINIKVNPENLDALTSQ